MHMKTLYYLEVAKSVDDNGNLIPARKMKYETLSTVAYEEENEAQLERFAMQGNLHRFVVRVKKAGWMKNLMIQANPCWFIRHE